MSPTKHIEIPIEGMDCAECSTHVRSAIAALPGVEKVEVFLATEKAVVDLDPGQVDLPTIRGAVKDAGYSVPEERAEELHGGALDSRESQPIIADPIRRGLRSGAVCGSGRRVVRFVRGALRTGALGYRSGDRAGGRLPGFS